jgi:glycosyltransferase involved in cell wall biosynthesis
MREFVVGYVRRDYAVQRNVLAAAPGCSYVQLHDWSRTLAAAARRCNGFLGREFFEAHDRAHEFRARWDCPRVDVQHLFNQISYGKRPWISSFETALPRFRCCMDDHHGERVHACMPVAARARHRARAISALAGNSCKRLIALSNCAAAIQHFQLRDAPLQRDAIARKLTILHPPQACLLEDVAAKPAAPGGVLRLMFVGSSFFRKGGMELLETLCTLVQEQRFQVQLTLVSDLRTDSYACSGSHGARARARQLIAANRSWISHYERLDNADVLRLMLNADIGVLPTYADTYGYSVLEFQSTGCPVISTDVRALPEINDDSRGWLIQVPKNSMGEALHDSATGRARISAAIRAGLESVLQQIRARPELVRQKARRALQQLRLSHDPGRFGERLLEIYADCTAARSGTPTAPLTMAS